MSNKHSESRTGLAGAGVVLGGLAIGAILSTATPAQAAEATDAVSVVAPSCPTPRPPASPVSFREAFQGAFTAGAIAESRQTPAVICDASSS